MSKIKVNEIEAATGSTVTIPTGQTFTVTDGIPATNLSGTIADARLPTVPVSKGGTGLTSLGSANQQLRVNSSGNALEFATIAAPSSDWVKIIAQDTSSDVGSLNWYHGVNGVVLDNTYRFYKIIGSLRPAVNGEDFRFRVGYHASGGNGIYTSGYLAEAHRSYYSGGTSRGNRSDAIAHCIGGTQSASEQRSNFEITFYNMSDAGLNTTAHMQYATIDGSGNSEDQVNQGTAGGCYATAGATNQIRLYTGSGSIGACETTLYGLK
jgi:hypothetical protein|tara:strand:+ start:277 stop:1074 length:798 start_codon:yes stop_codon:yes gene_type:complete